MEENNLYLAQQLALVAGVMQQQNAGLETTNGALVHAVTTGTKVHVDPRAPQVVPYAGTDRDSIERAEDDGLRVPPLADFSE